MPTVLITGGHKGLGLQATRTVARHGGFDIILAGRDRREMEAAARELATETRANIQVVVVDISSLAAVRSAADTVRQLVREGTVAPLQVLMLNAGAQLRGPVRFSADGFEQTFATNCLGHFLLLNLLLDEVQAGGRVVFTASGTHDPATADGRMVGKAVEPDAVGLAEQGKHGKPISNGKRYSTSKLCVMLYAYELDRRLRTSGSTLQAIAFDPGFIVETGLIRSAPAMAQRFMRTALGKGLTRMLGVTIGSIGFSGDALARLAIDPAFEHASGRYFQSSSGRLNEVRSSAMSYDVALARRLWVDSAHLVGLDQENDAGRGRP